MTDRIMRIRKILSQIARRAAGDEVCCAACYTSIRNYILNGAHTARRNASRSSGVGTGCATMRGDQAVNVAVKAVKLVLLDPGHDPAAA